MLERTVQKVDVGATPYLDVIDLRNAFIRIRSIECPDHFVDIYKSTLTRLADALVKAEREISL